MTKYLKISMLFISASALFIAGCGPQDLNASFDAQANESDVSSKEAGGCPTGDCEIAPDPNTHRKVQLPDVYKPEPVRVTPTGEKQIATDTVDTHQNTYVPQPHERHHRVLKHRVQVNRHFPRTIYQPSTRRINSVVTTFSQTSETMPVEEVTAPVVDHGCGAAAQPDPEPQGCPAMGGM